jgi:hypothetical protein
MSRKASFKTGLVGLSVWVLLLLSGCSIKLLSSEEVKGIAKELGVEEKGEKRELFKELSREAGKGFGVTSPVDSKEAGRGMAEGLTEVLMNYRGELPVVVDEKDKAMWEWVGHQRIREKDYLEAVQIFKLIGEKKDLAKLVLIYLDSGNSFQADRLLRYLKTVGYQFDASKLYQEMMNEDMYKFTLPFDLFFRKVQ